MICLETGSNCRHKDFQSFALPTELSKLLERSFIRISPCISNNFKKVCAVIFDKILLSFFWLSPFIFSENLLSLKILFFFFKNFDLNLSQSSLFSDLRLDKLFWTQNSISILISENIIVLTVFQVVKNLVI